MEMDERESCTVKKKKTKQTNKTWHYNFLNNKKRFLVLWKIEIKSFVHDCIER
jgi:hypothetical protein